MTRSIQQLDDGDLARLEGFTASLKPEIDTCETSTHPHRLYKLLCQAVRCYIYEHMQPMPHDPTLTGTELATMHDCDRRRAGGEGWATPGLFDVDLNSRDGSWLNEDIMMRQIIDLDEYLELLNGSPLNRL